MQPNSYIYLPCLNPARIKLEQHCILLHKERPSILDVPCTFCRIMERFVRDELSLLKIFNASILAAEADILANVTK